MTNALAEQGWSEQATPLEGGSVRCETCAQTTDAAELPCDSVHRVEGASDPGDMALVVAFTCPHCDTRDALVLSYGPEAPAADADVLVALPDPPDDRESGLAR